MRTRLNPTLLLVFAACFAPTASAQVFKCQQPGGLVTYSDKPCNVANRGPVLDRTTDAPDRGSRESFSKDAVLRTLPPKESTSKEAAAKPADGERVVTARADADVPAGRSAAPPDTPNADSLQLRALGPNQALDRQGRVYNRVPNGYLDANGTFYAGLASGHR
jgi:hypothetical protein